MTLFDEIASFENLHRAYLRARRGRRYRAEALRFGFSLEENLLALRRELLGKTYRHGPYRAFVVTDSKKRTIHAAPFRDRVIHHAVCGVIEPLVERTFIGDSYACRVGKGTHLAVRRLEAYLHALRHGEAAPGSARAIYCLQGDIAKYFESIDHLKLRALLERRVADPEVRWLLAEIIESYRPGIPIGNLTSQLFANVYLNELDHFVRRVLRERSYLRYMDDFVVLGLDKRRLAAVREEIRMFLRERLKLELHPRKAELFPVERGIDFLGYVVHRGYRRLRTRTVRRFVRRLRRRVRKWQSGELATSSLDSSLAAWQGYARHANAYRLRQGVGREIARAGRVGGATDGGRFRFECAKAARGAQAGLRPRIPPRVPADVGTAIVPLRPSERACTLTPCGRRCRSCSRRPRGGAGSARSS